MSKKRGAAPPRQRRRRLSREPVIQKKAIDLERGDVIYWDHQRAVVVEESDGVTSAPDDTTINGTPAWACCEPRIQFLTDTGRLSYRTTHILVPNDRQFIILDRRRDVRNGSTAD